MTDAKIIDAYERAYNIAQAVGADHRQPEMPSQRDRQTMARRVRGYVLSGNRGAADSSSFSGSAGGVGMRERKALATMGRKGGQKAAERWKTATATMQGRNWKSLVGQIRYARLEGRERERAYSPPLRSTSLTPAPFRPERSLRTKWAYRSGWLTYISRH